MTLPELGIIEGYYGRPWSWEARADIVRFLAPLGYRFHLYAPKAEPWLRERWIEDPPEETARGVRRFSRVCAGAGVRFGVGLSPFEIYREWNDRTRRALARKVEALDRLGIQDLALLFDDMDGALDGLAERQVEIAEYVRERTDATRFFVCPTYYSDDPTLDRVFGARPEGYLKALGRGLHPDTRVFWTGPEVVSRQISTRHVAEVAESLGRPPFLWDNYPVNDGARMSEHLHLRGFTGRAPGLAEMIAGHGVNPALQPVLTRIPMATLPDVYREGSAYDSARAFHRAARTVLGSALGDRVREDLLDLQDWGRGRLPPERAARLRERYGDVTHPGAKEILAWLDGAWGVGGDGVPTG